MLAAALGVHAGTESQPHLLLTLCCLKTSSWKATIIVFVCHQSPRTPCLQVNSLAYIVIQTASSLTLKVRESVGGLAAGALPWRHSKQQGGRRGQAEAGRRPRRLLAASRGQDPRSAPPPVLSPLPRPAREVVHAGRSAGGGKQHRRARARACGKPGTALPLPCCFLFFRCWAQ